MATDLGMLLIERINRAIQGAAGPLPDVTPEQLYEQMLIEEAGYAALEELEEQERIPGDEYWPARDWREEPTD